MDIQAADAASAAQQLKFSKVTTIFSQQNSELEHLFWEVTKILGPLNFHFFILANVLELFIIFTKIFTTDFSKQIFLHPD